MPILHIKVVPAYKGITNVSLDRDLQSQTMNLKKIVIIKPDLTYTQDTFKIRIPFMAGNELHTNDKRSFLTIPNDVASKFIDMNFDLHFGAEHIQNQFEIQLVDDAGANIVATTSLSAIHLYFEYSSNTLF